MGGGRGHSPKDTPDPGSDTTAHLYLCAVEYPKGYDWVKDTAYSTVQASLRLFRDGECIVSVPTGGAYQISTDPDTHWILDGHLITTFTDGSRTWVKRDGADLLCFDGAEDIKGLLLKDGILWTLGQKLRGQGFSLRADGTSVSENAQGTLIGTLYEDDGALCFAYGMTTKNGSYTIRRYLVSADGVEKEVPVPSDAVAVYDIRRRGGITYATYLQRGNLTRPVISTDSENNQLLTSGTNTDHPEWCEILPIGESDVSVKGLLVFKSGSRRYQLWSRTGILIVYTSNTLIHDFYADEKGNIAAVGYDETAAETVLFLPPSGRSRVGLGRKYRFITSRAACLADGKFHAGLTGEEGDLLWSDGRTAEMQINGPVTGLAYQ